MNNSIDRSDLTRHDGPIPSGEDVCLYIAELCGELRSLGQSPRFRTINYLLDMARLEAERSAKEFRSNAGSVRADERH